MARVAPTGMIFIPCRGGWSHRPDEFASEADIGNGVGVLALTMARLSAGAFPGKTEL
jgi:ureidoglycolate amidohydrolase